MSKKLFKFDNGDKVKCKVTGFIGIIISRMEWLNGCIQYCLKPKMKIKKGESIKMPEGEYIDEQQLELIKAKKINLKIKPTEGPGMDYPK
jgi:hypothetical protein